MDNNISDKVREKSPKFPGIGLDKAIEIIERASKHGISLKKETFAAFGSRGDTKGSAKSGAFIRRIAALKYFGLIEEKGGQIELTELAKRIIFSKNEIEKKKSLVESFLNPKLFEKLYTSTSKNTPIKKENLANIAVREYGITPKAKGNFISSFINSAEFVGLLNYPGNKDSIVLNDRGQDENIPQDQNTDDIETEKVKGGWNIVVSEKDQGGNYELIFRSKEMFSKDLWIELKDFIADLEKEFQRKDLSDKEKDKSEIKSQ